MSLNGLKYGTTRGQKTGGGSSARAGREITGAEEIVAGGRVAGSGEVVEQADDARRSAIIAEKQAELEKVYDKHDSLVREAFHMEHFRMMIGYNPSEAKQDTSAVFQDYKSHYDLLETAGSSTPGRSMRTRRAQNERKSFIQEPLLPSPSLPLSAPISVSSSSKRKGKAPESSPVWDILNASSSTTKPRKSATELPVPRGSAGSPTRSSKANGKRRAVDTYNELEVERPAKDRSRRTKRIKETREKRERGRSPYSSDMDDNNGSMDLAASIARAARSNALSGVGVLSPARLSAKRRRGDVPSESISAPLGSGKRTRQARVEDSAVLATKLRTVQSVPRIKLTIPSLRRPSGVSPSESQTPTTSPDSTLSLNARPASHGVKRSVTAIDFSDTQPFKEEHDSMRLAERNSTVLDPRERMQRTELRSFRPEMSPLLGNAAKTQPWSPIKRIKLIVRRPVPLISSPVQRAPSQRFNSSLSDLLSSYTTDGDEEVDAETLALRSRSKARLLERVSKLKKQGRFFGNVDLTASGAKDIVPQRDSFDTWDHCIQDVVTYLESRKTHTTGKEIVAQITAGVQSYWDAQAIKLEKMKAQEERRLRALAKATIKLVTGEWKKAVFHLREQDRLRREAEEVRRGHEHLDAILDQSGQILETQHGDLSRGDRSRSRSVDSGASAGFTWDDNQEDEDEEEEQEQSGIGGDSERDETEKSDEFDVSQKSDSPDDEVQLTLQDLLTGEDSPVNDPSTGILESSQRSDLIQTSTWPQNLGDFGHTIEFTNDEASHSHSLDLTPPMKHSDSHVDFLRSFSSPSHNDSPLAGDTSSPSTVVILTPPNNSTEFPMSDVDDPKIVEIDSSIATLDTGLLSEGVRIPETISVVAKIDSNGEDSPDPVSTADTGLTVAVAPESTDPEELGSGGVDPSQISTLQSSITQPTDDEDEEEEEESEGEDGSIPAYLKPYAVAHVEWDPDSKLTPPLLLRGVLRPYQFTGLEWLASLHTNNLNGILADEMGLGKTIQTIALLAHLACDRGIWGPHLIIVPTSVLLNWEMEFKKFLPGFRILSYHGTTKRRKELRQGWNDKTHFNVCITSYTLASRDAHIFKRKHWYYMILDEAHMIKNFKSQRWNTLLMFRSFRRLLLTGTPLQNNLTELWALLQFLMSGAKFANLKEFGEWFSNPLEKAIEMGNVHDDETLRRVSKLHTVLRPYLLRRLKRDVEKELPSKYEHLVLCPLSKRQRFLYDEFMARAQTRDALQSGVYQKIANILMQLRKVCNHPDLFEVRPIVTSFTMGRSAIADYEIKELLIRRRLLSDDRESLDVASLGFCFVNRQNTSGLTAIATRRLDASSQMKLLCEDPGPRPPKDLRTIKGFRTYSTWQRRAETVARWSHTAYLNHLRCTQIPIYSSETISLVRKMHNRILPLCHLDPRSFSYLNDVVPAVHQAVLSYEQRAESMAEIIDRFAFITPPVVARDVAQIALAGRPSEVLNSVPPTFDEVIHRPAVKLQIAFPSPSLLQYDCGKLQRLTSLLREKKAGGHRVLLFTQMTKILDILEIFLNFHGYLYLRLDGATRIEDRQYITERFNKDAKIFCFIASSRSGGVGINLTGADTVIFYDSDFNPQMDRQCEDRAHRIGQMRDVHIYRFVSEHTVEEAMLLKANQKRSLDDLVIQKGQFDWRSLFRFDSDDSTGASEERGIDSSLFTKALGEFDDTEDALAARLAEREENAMEGADEADFGLGTVGVDEDSSTSRRESHAEPLTAVDVKEAPAPDEEQEPYIEDGEEEEGGTTVEYMLAFIDRDPDFFAEWRL